MAGISVSLIVLLSVLLLESGGAHATIFIPVPGIVTGPVCCTPDGNCPGTGAAGATVTLTCLGSLLNPGVSISNTTTATGIFSISANITTYSISSLTIFSRCYITVQLPVPAADACFILSNTGGTLFSFVRRTGQVNGAMTGAPIRFVRINN
ncbi:hypothetical protein SASPL_112968 [Salvia splendens]|uniref:Uncharacterized protein n=1 Tax=Salvia splendens TaxID=180675 RepID=A0A8X9A4Q0_SALSN|nr:hypothetical protein SASPL_112968 [Salvia splendens]